MNFMVFEDVFLESKDFLNDEWPGGEDSIYQVPPGPAAAFQRRKLVK